MRTAGAPMTDAARREDEQMATTDHYDVIIIGSGAGGGSLALRLAPSGKRILLLERGGYLPRERDNWETEAVFLKGKYLTTERWLDVDGNGFTPEQNYNVGGNTKFYGAALFRLRPEDFGELTHHGGLSPAWPITYDELEPYYAQAEDLFYVHGKAGEDPTDGPRSAEYPFAPVEHEPRIQQLSDDLEALGLHPSHLPIGVMLDQDVDGRAAARAAGASAATASTASRASSTARPTPRSCASTRPSPTPTSTSSPTPRSSGWRPTPRAVRSPRSWPRSATAPRRATPATSSWCPAARSTRRCCCCARRTTPIRTAWPTARTRSGATTCATTTWP